MIIYSCLIDHLYNISFTIYNYHFYISNLLSGNMSFFWYLTIKLSVVCCLWTILWWSCWNFCSFISNLIVNQINSYFCCFLNYFFWSSFKCICCRFFSMIIKFLSVFTTLVFTYAFTNIYFRFFWQKTEIHIFS